MSSKSETQIREHVLWTALVKFNVPVVTSPSVGLSVKVSSSIKKNNKMMFWVKHVLIKFL